MFIDTQLCIIILFFDILQYNKTYITSLKLHSVKTTVKKCKNKHYKVFLHTHKLIKSIINSY